jgi:thioredoxin 1
MGAAAKSLTNAEFETLIAQSATPVVVDFGATWCGPCQALAPHIEKMAVEFAGKAVIAKVDVDDEPDLAGRFGVMSVPTVLFFKGGKKVDTVMGNQPDAIRNKLKALI